MDTSLIEDLQEASAEIASSLESLEAETDETTSEAYETTKKAFDKYQYALANLFEMACTNEDEEIEEEE